MPTPKPNQKHLKTSSSRSAFTIVELLIVIVVIAILAVIISFAYSGLQDRARAGVLQSDLSNAAKQLAIDKATNSTSSYPETINPDGSGDANGGKGIKASDNTTYEYTVDNDSNPQTFCLTAKNTTQAFHVTQTGTPQEGVCDGHSEPGGGEGETVAACTDYNIGDTGPAGGIIFYKDTTTTPTTCYEAAPAGWYEATAPDDPTAEWGCSGTFVSGADGVAIGTGKQNTADILAAGCLPNTPGNLLAAMITIGYTGGDISDWYLPSKNELHEMYSEKDSIGGFTASYYWSSSEYSPAHAWQQHLSGDSQNGGGKTSLRNVRPIRSF